MGKRPTEHAIELLRTLAELMAALPDQGTPTADARLLRELAERVIDRDDAWGALVLTTLERVLAEGGSMARAGSLALAEMLRELDASKP